MMQSSGSELGYCGTWSVSVRALPAAATNSAPAAPAAAMASSSVREYGPPPQELLVTRMPMRVAYWSASTAPETGPLPPAPRNLSTTIFACQTTPETPSPLFPTAAMMPAVCVPWPLSSRGSPSWFRKS